MFFLGQYSVLVDMDNVSILYVNFFNIYKFLFTLKNCLLGWSMKTKKKYYIQNIKVSIKALLFIPHIYCILRKQNSMVIKGPA